MRVLALFSGGFCGAVLWIMLGLPYTVAMPAGALVGAAILAALRRPVFLRLGLVLLGVGLGVLWCWSTVQEQTRWTSAFDGRVLTLSLEAASYSRDTDYGTSTTVRGVVDGHDFTAILYGPSELALEPEDRLQGLVKLQSTDTFWGEKELYYGAQGMDFTMQLYSQYEISPGAGGALRYLPLRIAHTISDQLAKLLPQEEWGFSVALLSGERSGLSQQFNTQLSQSGTKHVVAVSGMHIGILMGAVMLLFGQYGWKTSVVGIPLIWLFALSVGMSASVTRAAWMFTFVLGAQLADRDHDVPTTILATLLFLLLPDPRAILDVGLQLSFASVAGILMFSSRIFQLFWDWAPLQWTMSHCRFSRKLIRPVCAGISSSIAVIPLTLPLSLLYFGSYSMAATLSGAFIVPLIPLCFLLSLVAALVSLMWMPGALLLAHPLRLVIGCCMGLIRWVAGLPFSMVTLGNGYSLIFLAMVYGIVLIVACTKTPVRLWVPAAGIVCSFLGCLLLGSLEYDRAKLSVTMLDMGQGQSIYVESKGVTALYDCGGEAQPAAHTVSFLQTTGRFHLDVLVVSHYDSDHAGGVPDLLRSISVDTIYLPAAADVGGMQADILTAADETGTRVCWVEQDLLLTFGAASLSIYAPVQSVEGNNGSLSAHWRCDDFDLLVTGDMDADAEALLINRQFLSAVEVLVAGHHGAATSTSQTLLDQLTPELVLISVGEDNSYGHPAEETLLRLQQSSAAVYRTDQCGNITIRR